MADSNWAAPGGRPPAFGTPESAAGTAPPTGGYSAAPPSWTAPPGWTPTRSGPVRPELKPGVIPLRPLGVGELLDAAFTTCRRYARPVYALALLVLTASFALAQGVQLALVGTDAYSVQLGGAGASFTLTDFASIGASSIVGYFITAAAEMLLTGLVAVVVGEAVLGRQVEVGAVLRRVRPLLPALLVASVLAAALPLLGLAALLVGGVFLWGVLGLLTPALVLERLGLRAAFRRTFRLVLPDFFRVLGIRALGYLIGQAVSAALITVPAVIGVISSVGSGDASLSRPALIALVVLSFVAAVVVQPFLAVLLCLLYLDRRMRAEALDLQLRETVAAASRRGRPDASGAAPPARLDKPASSL